MTRRQRYLRAYARLREIEGRGSGGETELLALPHLTSGPLAGQWEVRARTFDAFVAEVLEGRQGLEVLDLGAGNGWLCHRLALLGHRGTAVDLRLDAVDGLGAAAPFTRHLSRMFPRVAASFEALPFRAGRFDLALFNASLHYAESLDAVLLEAARTVKSGGTLAILDSPFYRAAADGKAMLAEKERSTRARFPELADDLLAPRFVEYFTPESLDEAARPLGLAFRCHRVGYPEWYECREEEARRRGERAPSRFDLWLSAVP